MEINIDMIFFGLGKPRFYATSHLKSEAKEFFM